MLTALLYRSLNGVSSFGADICLDEVFTVHFLLGKRGLLVTFSFTSLHFFYELTKRILEMKLDGEVAQKFEKPVYIRDYNLAEHLFVSQHAT